MASQIVSLINCRRSLVLDAHDAAVAVNGCKVQLWATNSELQQQWEIENVDGEWCKIICRASGLVLDAHATTVGNNGCKVQLWTYHGGKNQQWRIVYDRDGMVYIQNRAGKLFLDANAPDAAGNGCTVQLWSKGDANGFHQKWVAVIGKKLHKEIASVSNGGKVRLLLSTSGTSTTKNKIMSVNTEWVDTDFGEDAGDTTGGRIGLVAGVVVGVIYAYTDPGPDAGENIFLWAFFGETIGFVLDRVFTFVFIDITGPLWEQAGGRSINLGGVDIPYHPGLPGIPGTITVSGGGISISGGGIVPDIGIPFP